MSLAVRPGDCLRRFIGLEAQISRFVFVRFGVVAEAVVTQHQVVMCLQVFGIDRKCLFEFLYRIGVAPLQKQNAAKFVAHNTVARELREHDCKWANCAVVFAIFLEGARVKEIRPPKPRVDRQGFLQNSSRASSIPLLHQNAADVGPAVGILRSACVIFSKAAAAAFKSPCRKSPIP